MINDLPKTTLNEMLREFCQRWQITELAFFGSVLREDFGPDSDVDVLVSFERVPGTVFLTWTTWNQS